jgi:hypothetical protein
VSRLAVPGLPVPGLPVPGLPVPGLPVALLAVAGLPGFGLSVAGLTRLLRVTIPGLRLAERDRVVRLRWLRVSLLVLTVVVVVHVSRLRLPVSLPQQ